MTPDDLIDELEDLKRRVETLEKKLLVFPDVMERLNNGLKINDPEFFIINVVKNHSGLEINVLYQETLKLYDDYEMDKFDFLIDTAVKRGLIARKGNQLYYASETGNSKGLRTSCPYR